MAKPAKTQGKAKKTKQGAPAKASAVAARPVAAEPAVRRWPLRAWESDVDRWFDAVRRRMGFPDLWAWGPRLPQVELELHAPAADVYEEADEVIVKAEMPGMSKDEIEVSLTDSMLTIRGDKKKEEEVKEKDYYRCERSFGSVSRTLQLPAAIKIEQAKATYKDGVLEIHLPKTEEAKRKQTKVQIE